MMTWRDELEQWAHKVRPPLWKRLLPGTKPPHFRFEIGPATNEKAIHELEREKGEPMPASLRRFLLEESAHVMFWWDVWDVKEPPALPGVREVPKNGCFEFNLQCLHNLSDSGASWMFGDESADVRERWVRSWAVIHAANGDLLALDVTVDADDPPVIFLNHEMHEAIWTVSPSWDQFLDDWARLGCVGPEGWNLEPFCQRRGDEHAENADDRPYRFDSRCVNATQFRAHFGFSP